MFSCNLTPAFSAQWQRSCRWYTAGTQEWSRYRNKSQHRKLILEKKILPSPLRRLKPTTFWSRVWYSTTELSERQIVWSKPVIIHTFLFVCLILQRNQQQNTSVIINKLNEVNQVLIYIIYQKTGQRYFHNYILTFDKLNYLIHKSKIFFLFFQSSNQLQKNKKIKIKIATFWTSEVVKIISI